MSFLTRVQFCFLPVLAGFLLGFSAFAQSDGSAGEAVQAPLAVAVPDTPYYAFISVEGTRARVEPGATGADAGWESPIILPLKILDAICLDAKSGQIRPVERQLNGRFRTECPGGAGQAIWYKVAADSGKKGWIASDDLTIWSSRLGMHRPTQVAHESSLNGYCSEDDADRASRGEGSPCVTIKFGDVPGSKIHPSYFPILDTKIFGDGIEFDQRIYHQVLVPAWRQVPTEESTQAGGDTDDKNSQRAGRGLELIVALDISRQNAEAVEAFRKALDDLNISDIEKSGVSVRFAIVAHSDGVKGSDQCRPIYATTTQDGKVGFVSLEAAKQFLAGLDTGCSSRSGKTFWDAIHLFRDLNVKPGSFRNFVVIGKSPDRFSTVGMTFDGAKVPGGLKAEKAIRDLVDIFGESTRFDAFWSHGSNNRKASELILKNARFFASSTMDIKARKGDAFADIFTSHLKNSISLASEDVTANNRVTIANRSWGDVAVFNTLNRVAAGKDSKPEGNSETSGHDGMIAMRKVWVARSPSYQDFIRASVDEAGVLIEVFEGIAKTIDEEGNGCQKLDVPFWVESLRPLAPGISQADFGNGDVPPVQTALIFKGFLKSSEQESIFSSRYTISQITSLDRDRCLAIRSRFHKASERLSEMRKASPQPQFIMIATPLLPL
ncbi:MAG TPA: hypothetical protein PLB35_05310 [Myxococcota bacterium]|nr:hypothetical protein [Myxococcota bacterium]